MTWRPAGSPSCPDLRHALRGLRVMTTALTSRRLTHDPTYWYGMDLLVTAGILGIGWSIGLRYTKGFSRLWPGVLTVCAMIAGFILLADALKTTPSARVTPSGRASGLPARPSSGWRSSANRADPYGSFVLCSSLWASSVSNLPRRWGIEDVLRPRWASMRPARSSPRLALPITNPAGNPGASKLPALDR